MAEDLPKTRSDPQPPEGPLPEIDRQVSLEGAETMGGVATSAGLDALSAVGETTDNPRAILGAYFDRYMANPHFGRMADDPEKMVAYRDMFTGFLTTAFNPDLIAQKPWPDQDFYPAVNEFAGMLASIHHNAGVYYGAADVPGIFLAVANDVVDDELFQQDMGTVTTGRDAIGLSGALRSCLKRKMSIDSETVLALVKAEDGQWVALEKADVGEPDKISPLEVIRQDNDDKEGWNKYRFRQPVYVRSKDEAHPREVADGWYASEWHMDPNYWSAELRNMLVTTAEDIDDRLEGIGAHVVMITEGGILKGTSTTETDMDTECIVVCDSTEDFVRAGKVAATVFAASFAGLPFPTKHGEISPRFFDRSDGKIYFCREEGEYSASKFGEIFKGRYVFGVRKNEKGVGVTTSRGFSPHRKSKEADVMHIFVDLESGGVAQLSNQELKEYESAQKEVRARRQVVPDGPDIIW
ncbi:hypothetical protein E6P97_00325 [Patescibacteria group bacterium]|nr:MAG: hypothetical protein E6P97_00325 [Patescibacteria group bacterium]